MTPHPKRVTIEALILEGNKPCVELKSAYGSGDILFVSGGCGAEARFYPANAHAAREYATMLHGAAEQLVEWAQAREAEANASAEAARC